MDQTERNIWRMPTLGELPPVKMTPLARLWMIVLLSYLLLAAGLVLLRIGRLAISSG